MGGKSSAPTPPDYGPLALAQANVGNQQFVLGEQQLQASQNQFNQIWPYAQQYMHQQALASQNEMDAAQQQQQYYNQTYRPLESKFANEASTYDSPDRINQNRAAAMQDVQTEFAAARQSALHNLESYGIDPSQARYGALDMGTRISQAAAMAGAGTQSALNTRATGMALQGEAINVGRGYPSAIAQSYNTATNSGASGINAANQTTQIANQGMGVAGGIMAGASNSYAGSASALNSGYSNAMQAQQYNAQQSGGFWSGAGTLIGGAIGAYFGGPAGAMAGASVGSKV